MNLSKVTISLNLSDLEVLKKTAKEQGLSLSRFIAKSIDFGIKTEQLFEADIDREAEVTNFCFYLTPELKKEFNDYCEKHKIIKSRWVVGLIVPREQLSDRELATTAEKIGYKLLPQQLQQIREKYSLLLDKSNEKLNGKIIKQYFLNQAA